MKSIEFERYSEYKECEEELFEEIPSHWEMLANKYIFKLKKTQVGKRSNEYDLLSLTLKGIIKRDMENPEGKFPADFDTYQEVKKGDFVFCLFDVEETPRTVGLSNYEGMITGAYTVLEASDKFDEKYLYYFYLNLDLKKRLKMLYKGLRNTISKESFFSFKTFIPPLQEQIAIAKFLDEKCNKIDKAITQKEKLIELLNERKQIIIQKAVTKGLNPDAEMKKCEIELFEEIPSHWKLLANRHIFKLKKTQVGKRSNEYDLLSLTLKGIIKRDMENPEGKFPADFDTYQEVKKGDFVFCLFDVEETPRAVGLSNYNGMITGAYTVLEANDKFDKKYLYYFYLNLDLKKRLKMLYKGLRNTIPKPSFLSFKTFVPPFEEQEKIVSYIEEETKKIDNAVLLQEKQLQKLKEYREILIDNTVTGKIKVGD